MKELHHRGIGERNMKSTVFYLLDWGNKGLDPAQGVPHGHRLPQCCQHLVPVSNSHPTGLRADDHMTEVLATAVFCGLRHGYPQGEFLQTHGHTVIITVLFTSVISPLKQLYQLM